MIHVWMHFVNYGENSVKNWQQPSSFQGRTSRVYIENEDICGHIRDNELKVAGIFIYVKKLLEELGPSRWKGGVSWPSG